HHSLRPGHGPGELDGRGEHLPGRRGRHAPHRLGGARGSPDLRRLMTAATRKVVPMTELRQTQPTTNLPGLGRRTFLQGAAVSAAVIATGALFRPAAAATGDPVLRLTYDQPNGSTTILDEVGRSNFTVHVSNNP